MSRRAELVAVAGGADAEDGESSEATAPGHPGVVVPTGMEALLSTSPCFRPSLRGYDRVQVDSYVAWSETEIAVARRQVDDLLARLAACATDLEAARRAAAGRDRSGMPAPIVDLLARAAEEARQVTEVAVREARRMTEAAALQARRTTDTAAEEARRTTEAADAEAEQILAEARLEAQARLSKADAIVEAATAAATERLAAAQRDVEDLRRQRDEAQESLRRLTSSIGEALRGVVFVGNDVARNDMAPNDIAQRIG